MLEEIRTTTLQGTGIFSKPVRDISQPRQLSPVNEEARVQKELEKQRKTTQPIPRLWGEKTEDYQQSRAHLDRLVGHYQEGKPDSQQVARLYASHQH